MLRHSAAYVKTIRDLYAINTQNPVKMGLTNSLKLYELLGRPLDRIPIIHVGGTNGKGSVCVKVNECLILAGIKTGLFVSPHISSFRERIQVNSRILTEEECISNIQMIIALCKQNSIPATFFEITTALSFLTFQQNEVEAIVLEVGLGGRLDATNVVSPIVSVITSIQLDHCRILGDTIEKIALEKAGIIKPNIPVIIGPDNGNGVIQKEALRIGSPVFSHHDLLSPFERRYHGHSSDVEDLNNDLAHSVLKLLSSHHTLANRLEKMSSSSLQHALEKRPPCRFEVLHVKSTSNVDVTVILDIAHNLDAMRSLVERMRSKYPNRSVRVVLGMSRDKDIRPCVLQLLTLTQLIHCTQARQPRAIPGEELSQIVASLSLAPTPTSSSLDNSSVSESIKTAIQLSASNVNGGIVLVCGTAFIMSDARAALGIVEPRDGDILLDLLGAGATDMQESFALTTPV